MSRDREWRRKSEREIIRCKGAGNWEGIERESKSLPEITSSGRGNRQQRRLARKRTAWELD